MVRNAAPSVTDENRSKAGTANADVKLGITKSRVTGWDTRRRLLRTVALAVNH
jgi:hypothetical protein